MAESEQVIFRFVSDSGNRWRIHGDGSLALESGFMPLQETSESELPLLAKELARLKMKYEPPEESIQPPSHIVDKWYDSVCKVEVYIYDNGGQVTRKTEGVYVDLPGALGRRIVALKGEIAKLTTASVTEYERRMARFELPDV